MRLEGKKILLGITGSIAAYKAPYLVRMLVKEGAHVEVIMTDSARDFVTPLTLSTVSTHPVHWKPFDSASGAWDSHVEMGTTADLYLIAPVSANTLGKMVSGQADNLLVTTYLAATCPVMFAPAMDLDMFKHVATQNNIKELQGRGHIIIQPQEGELASGLVGCGRMEEPGIITEKVVDFFLRSKKFSGKKVLITAGPTYENIDPVRFIGNYSSGKMGLAIAETFASQGAEVTLVAGPGVPETTHPSISRKNIVSAEEMFREANYSFDQSDIAVMAAAVADFTPENKAHQKIKKSDSDLNLPLKPTQDILKSLGEKKKEQFLAGFALETENHEANALSKLKNKNADMLVLNSATDPGEGFGGNTNRITIFDREGTKIPCILKNKTEVALDIVDFIAQKLKL